ncbi:hypothetical protein [Proteiniphilum acetatigenes]|uniref:hypothetical protein n=1 Tax=Proteiniphilum acetatigenes TaxID=294710 RepID=UPI000365ECD5|nr:hypothetical protein [Proteiniphilum acetatigenes]
MIIRILENKVNRAGHKFSVGEIISTLTGIDFCSVPGGGGIRADIHKEHTHGPSAWIGRLQDGYPDHHKTNDEKIISSTRKKDEK